MSLARLCARVALIALFWPAAVLGQDIRALSVDTDPAVAYASGSSETAAQVTTVLELTTELKRLLQQFGPGKVPQILTPDQQRVSAANSTTPVRFRFRVGMFIEDVTSNMIRLFSGYQPSAACDKALVQSLENELKILESSGGGNSAVFRREVAAARKRCPA
jgi:hypothetical protein